MAGAAAALLPPVAATASDKSTHSELAVLSESDAVAPPGDEPLKQIPLTVTLTGT